MGYGSIYRITGLRWPESLIADSIRSGPVCEEIADHADQPVGLVMSAADERAMHEARPVEDVLRDRFHNLLL
jgi:hypothetical protein